MDKKIALGGIEQILARGRLKENERKAMTWEKRRIKNALIKTKNRNKTNRNITRRESV